MSDVPLSKIDVSRARNQLGKPSWAEGKAVHGFDTETRDGDIFAIGQASPSGYEDLYDPEGLDALEILSFITRGRNRGSLNVWFNLNFDANSILKALPESKLAELQFHNQTEWEDDTGREWSFTYIPKKMLEIRANKNAYSHFDAQQFTYKNLEGAAEDWLGMDSAKLNEDVDVEKFGVIEDEDDLAEKGLDEWTDDDVTAYLEDNETKIREYMKRDCELTREIFGKITEMAEDLNIPFGKPYSTGYVAADYVRNYLEYKPGYAMGYVQTPAWESYRGGRFEIAKRGDVGPVHGADINSAYPAVLADLPDPASLSWVNYGPNGVVHVEDADIEGADYGFLKITATTDASRPYQPFAIPNDDEGGRIEYPAIDGVTLWVLLDEFRFCENYGFFEEVEIHEAVLATEDDDTEFPFDFFKDLYTERKNLEEEDNERKAQLLKIVMNSIYGKTCQTNTDYTPAHEDERNAIELMEDGVDFATGPDGQNYIKDVKAGRLFNPFLATYITGRTRLKLLESVVEHGLEENTVMMATDCLMVESDAFVESDLYDEAESEADTHAEALGGWDYDYVGEAFVIGSGVYEVYTGDDTAAWRAGDAVDEDDIKKAVRGFRELYSDENDFATIREAAEMYPDGIPVKNARPVTMGDILHTGGDIGDIGKFTKTERSLTASMDTKREWENDEPTFADLLEGAEGSEPKTLSE